MTTLTRANVALGKNAKIKIDVKSPQSTVIEAGNLTQLNRGNSITNVVIQGSDPTTGNVAFSTTVGSANNITFDFTMNVDTTPAGWNTVMGAVDAAASLELAVEIHPLGTATGQPVWTFDAQMTANSMTSGVNAIYVLSGTLNVNGDITYAVVT